MPSPRYLFAAHCLAIAVAGTTSCSAEADPDVQAAGAETASPTSAGQGAGPAAQSGNVAASAGPAGRGATVPQAGSSNSGAPSAAASPTPAGSAASAGMPAIAGAGGVGGTAGATGLAGANTAGAAGATPSGPGMSVSGRSGSPGAAAGSGGAAAPSGAPITVFIAGDSTVSTYADTASKNDQAGWGQMLKMQVDANVKIENRAIGGRTARRFIDDGKLEEIWRDIKEGDYLLVQFGTNDSNKTATYTLNGQTIPYYLEPETDFKDYLKRYIDGARSHKAVPVLVTPPPRNSAYCTGGNGTGAWAQAMRELGMSGMLIVSDLNQRSVDYLKAICPAPEPPDFFLQREDGTVDGTHFQERGAQKLAEFVADGLREAGVTWVR